MLDTRTSMRFRIMRVVNKLLSHATFFDSIGLRFTIANHILPKPSQKTIVRSIHDFDIIVDPANRNGFIDNDLYYLGEYEASIIQLLKDHTNSDSVVLDIGANIGSITAYAARIAHEGRVIAFEPIPEILDDLHENIALNGYNNVEIYEHALGSITSDEVIYIDTDERGSSSLINKKPTDSSNNILKIHVEPLDKIAKSFQRIDLIKIDVEGYESEVLKGGLKTIQRCKPVIILEYDPQSPHRSDLDSMISKLNFNIYTLSKGKHYKSILVPVAMDGLATLPTDKLATIVMKP